MFDVERSNLRAPDPGPCDATSALSKPIRKNQLDQAGNPVRIKSLIADLILAVFLSGVTAPIRAGAVEVGESVLAGQSPGTEDAPALAFHLRIGGQRHHGAANISRRFRNHKIRGRVVLDGAGLVHALVPGLFPVTFGDFTMLQ